LVKFRSLATARNQSKSFMSSRRIAASVPFISQAD
jgi:hypothetical protein